ncbi:hypothetical protein SORBI_3010G174300 [Sorghum bicolor]|uniref:Uncharacterized protein n=1 Tax=Sorghum bicolor TaxID=4558 RepID=A0A194YJW1_SORBI|nr:hypothetical protein SORBI_3010G174300 [Sorghum bicolor]OQU76611.1 hypothetical protein SORBI_3010G174300 [Sorghum bicolor]
MPNWREETRLRISQEAEGVRRSPPPCFRRLDAFGNPDHPSIFKRRHKTSDAAAATSLSSLLQLPSPSNPSAPPPSELGSGSGAANRAPVQAGCSAAGRRLQLQLQASTDDDDVGTGRDIVLVAAVGPYQRHQRRSPPLITRANKCGIVMFLADRFGLDAADFLGWARSMDAQARCCYERDSFVLSPEEMAEMLLLDGCLVLFAVFLLSRNVCEGKRAAELARDEKHGKDFIYLSADISLHTKQTRLDLLMLENQIPFFVLAELHRRLKGTLFDKTNHSIQELALSCFDDIHPGGAHLAASAAANDDEFPFPFPPKVHHLLHLFHWSRVPRGKHTVGVSSIVPKEPEPHLPCATELEESLARLKKKATETTTGRRRRCSLDMSFQRDTMGMRAVMAIPALCVHNYSDCVFRSLIAFEQNHLRCGLGATAYSICMARLLQSEADVKLLRKRGILVHTQKSDKEIVDFFRGLRDEYADTCLPDDLLRLCKQVAAHQQSRPARVVRRVGRQCFPRQTVTFFVIVGTIISIATLVNTIHSMYSPYREVEGG